MGDPLAIAQSLNNLGTVAIRSHHVFDAVGYLTEALQLAWKSRNMPTVWDIMVGIGECLCQEGDNLMALELLTFVANHAQDSDTLAEVERLKGLIRPNLNSHDLAHLQQKKSAFSQEEAVTLAQNQLLLLLKALTPPPLPPLPSSSTTTSSLPVSQAFIAPAGNYTLDELLARGGMGELFRGRNSQTGQIVAIKRLLPHLVSQNSEALVRFQREADLLGQLNHPNIVKMFDTYQEKGEYWLVMEYVPGGSLRDLLDKTAILPFSRVLHIALELADALARAHHLGIIHRDLKPANILLATDGSPRLADFGIARLMGQETRLTQTGATLGTFAYMSPEACLGEEVDVRADVWSFGVLLYEMLTGRNPFERSHFAATLTAILHQPLPVITADLPGLSPALELLVSQLLTRERESRPGSMRQIAAKLEEIALQNK